MSAPYPNAPSYDSPKYPGGVPGPYDHHQGNPPGAPPAYNAAVGPQQGYAYQAGPQGQSYVQHQGPVMYQQVPHQQYQTHVIREYFCVFCSFADFFKN